MNDLQKYFLSATLENLQTLQKDSTRDFSENRRLEAFHLLHTIKGTAQTFELREASRIAHELENLLGRAEITTDETLRALLAEGIDHLIAALEQNSSEADEFLQRLQKKKRELPRAIDILLTSIPPDVFRRFSETEKNAAMVALRQKKKILCAEVGFERADFADRYRALRKTLGEHGTVIAALPSASFEAQGKIGFQIFLASEMSARELQKTIENFPGEIVSHTCQDAAADDLYETLSSLVTHAQTLAESLGKRIEFSVLASNEQFPAELNKTIFELLLHLVRNAVDHAIELEGKIEIHLLAGPHGLELRVADNGCGIDHEKIKKCAAAQNLIPPDAELNEQQTLELIFASEISTACRVTEISGRGVGLSAVKDLVEKKGGKISVRNRKTKGAVFEIFLPPEQI